MMEVNIMNPDCKLMPHTHFSVQGSILCNQGHIVAMQCTLFTS